MPIATLDELLEAGVHFGTRAARWNPKMKPYIHSKRSKIYIIDLRETLKGLIRAYHFLLQTTAKGKKVLFVGTKRQAADVVRQEAQRCGSFFVANRWLGGTLTNMQTMRNRILRLEELEGLEESGAIHQFSKKMISSLARERKKIHRNFEGIRQMKELPGAIVLVDPDQEHIALAEAIKLGIPTIAIADTDCNPDPVDFLIAANEDSIRSNQLILSKLADGIIEGSKRGAVQAVYAGAAKDAAPAQPKEEEEDKGIENLPKDFSELGGFSFGGDDD